MDRVADLLISVALIFGVIAGAALIASGYAEVSKLGSALGVVELLGGIVLLLGSYLLLRRRLKAERARGADRTPPT
jgi:hypothetical protein